MYVMTAASEITYIVSGGGRLNSVHSFPAGQSEQCMQNYD